MTTIGYAPNNLLSIVDAPELTGTPQQIARASSIRADLFDCQIRQRFEALRRIGKIADDTAVIADLSRKLAPLYDTRTDARWWIDNANCDLNIEAKLARGVAA